MTTLRVAANRPKPSAWSVAALVLAGVGVAVSTWLIVWSDGDPTHVRWWLVVAPVVICLAPMLLPRRSVRIGAAALLGVWCVLAAASIGFLLVPALFALLAATKGEER